MCLKKGICKKRYPKNENIRTTNTTDSNILDNILLIHTYTYQPHHDFDAVIECAHLGDEARDSFTAMRDSIAE